MLGSVPLKSALSNTTLKMLYSRWHEWFMAADCKSVEGVELSVGSNPTLSANERADQK